MVKFWPKMVKIGGFRPFYHHMTEQTYYDIVLLSQKTKNNSALYSSFILLKLVEYSPKRSTPLKSEIYGNFIVEPYCKIGVRIKIYKKG